MFDIIFKQIGILFIIALIGYVAARFNKIDEKMRGSLAHIIIDITLPLLIFTSLTQQIFSLDIARNMMWVFFLTYLIMGITYLWGTGFSRLLRLGEQTSKVHTLHTMFGNVIFMGYPILNALYPGGIGLLYATIFQMASDSILWTFGIIILRNDPQDSLRNYLKHLLNPNTFAFILGAIFMVAGIRLPEVINQSLGSLGHTTLYLSMLYIGAVLAGVQVTHMFKHAHVFIHSLNKLLILPLLFAFMLKALIIFGGVHLGRVPFTVVVLQSAMPAMAVIVIYARRFGGDDITASENVFMSTVLSLGTLPLMLWISQYIFDFTM